MVARPCFRMENSSQAANVTIRVNDVVIDRSEGIMPLESSIPVTPWLRHGLNRIELELTPAAGREQVADAKAAICVHEWGSYKETQRPLSTLSWEGNLPDHGRESSPPDAAASPVSIRTRERTHMLMRDVRIDDSIPQWAWMTAPEMADTPELRTALRSEYEQIVAHLSDRNSRYFVSLLEERTREYRLALHADAEDVPADYGVSKLAEQQAGFVYPLDFDSVRLVIEGGGRLASFVRHDFEPLVAIDLPVGALYLNFVFRRGKDGLIVCR